ncbi:MAG: tRNA pseudouridine(55) synthase TruB [Bacteroidales bacterium]|nr:tRNA pseudouridine(55) synthase TruB [Bacteroidales bacterium]
MDFAGGARLAIDKPLTWTSFDAVNKIRFLLKRHLGIKKIKVGHAGTLDPLATGLIIVCTGRATKTLQTLTDHDKEYVATLKLGATTPSFDGETEVDATYPTAHIDLPLVEKTLRENFTGRIDQVPPTFSAIRVDGHRAYEYARKGRHDEIELASRPVEISLMEIADFAPETMTLTLRIGCSKGTYIRSLARDIGAALGSGAYLTALRRTRVGDVSVEQAMTMEQVEDLIRNQKPIEPAADGQAEPV